MVKDDVAPNQVGGNIGNDPRCERPIVVVPLIGRVQAAEPRLLRRMAGRKVEGAVLRGHGTARLYERGSHSAKPFEPCRFDEVFQQQISTLEVELPLVLG